MISRMRSNPRKMMNQPYIGKQRKLEPIINKLKEMDLKLEIEEYLNFIARNNYYIEAAGGILITGSSETGLSGAGSFAIMYFNTVVLH